MTIRFSRRIALRRVSWCQQYSDICCTMYL